MNAETPVQAGSRHSDEAEEVDLGQLLTLVWGGRWALLIALTVSCTLGSLYLVIAKPIFEANGMVQVEQESKSMSSSMGELASLFGAPMETQAELQILKSRMVLNKVIDNLNLLVDTEPVYFPLLGAFVSRQRAKSRVAAGVAPELEGQAGAQGWLDSFAWSAESAVISKFEVPGALIGKPFTVTVLGGGKFLLDGPDGNKVLEGVVGEQAAIETPWGQLEIFVRDIDAAAGKRFKVTRWSRATLLQRLQDRIKVAEAGKQSGIIQLTVEARSAALAADIIKQIEDAYVRQNVERRSAEAQQSLEFLQQQLPEIKVRADAAQTRLNAYQQKQGSVNVTKETELVLQQAVDFETKKLELMGQRQQLIQRFTPQHPTVQALDAQISGLEAEQGAIRKRAETLPETQQEVLSLMRDLEVNTQLYTTLLNSAQELQVAKAGTVGNVRIIDYPMVPDRKSKPKAWLVLTLSVALGLCLGVAYLFVRKALFRGVDRPDEIEQALGLPTYAAVPYTPVQQRLGLDRKKLQVGERILALREPDNVAIEALRSLRTSLQFAMLESSNNVVMFTGPTQGLGKSFISLNLGAVMAQSGKRVVVVDADLRRGRLHKYIGEAAVPGLSNYVAGNAEMAGILRKTPIDNLWVVANGTTPPNPSELLLHERFAQLIRDLSQAYDLVIVDTPPVLPVTDASIVGRLAGCVLLVLKEGEHPMRHVDETVRRLRQAGVQIRGTVFSQVGRRGKGYGYYGAYGYGYSYASKYGADKR